MGATTKKESNFNFYKVVNFELQKACKQTDTGAIAREYNDKMYYYQAFKSVNGLLHSLTVEEKESKDGKQKFEILHIWLKDIELNTFEAIEMYYHSREAQSFLNAIKNANLNEVIEVEICKDKEKETTFLLIKQNEAIIKRYYTKENPNGLPPLENVGTVKKPKWIDVKMYDFYEAMIKDLNESLHAKREAAKVEKLPENLQPNNEFDIQKN
jgi:hypothetical protein